MMRACVPVLLFVLLALALTGGCAADRPQAPPEPVAPELSRVQLVQPGMSPAEVRDLLGEPELVETPDAPPGTRIWHYNGGVVMFRDDRVAFRHAKPREE
jgi:outer membrane protein assembly factor BamE (lipoprotein component of BamABCDE complex)